MKGRIHSRETFGTVDGPGIRYVLFLQGCPLRCLYCHNPDSQEGEGNGLITVQEAVDDMLRYRPFIRSGGVTFSGGEPLIQAPFISACTALLHKEGVHIAVDTSGCESPERPGVRQAIDDVDMLLLDIKAADDDLARKLTGQDVQNAFATLDYCEKTGKPVWIRHVLVHGYTLDEVQLTELAARLKGYTCIEWLELLPFHKMGEAKWQSLGREYKLYDTPATTEEEARWAGRFFRDCRFEIAVP